MATGLEEFETEVAGAGSTLDKPNYRTVVGIIERTQAEEDELLDLKLAQDMADGF